jgi:hypothetical protein
MPVQFNPPSLDQGASPSWAHRFADSVRRAFESLSGVPLLAVATVAELPPAAKSYGALVWVTALNRLAYCNGTSWIRTDTGAIL